MRLSFVTRVVGWIDFDCRRGPAFACAGLSLHDPPSGHRGRFPYRTGAVAVGRVTSNITARARPSSAMPAS